MNKKYLMPFLVLAAILTFSSCSNKLKPLAEEYIKAEPHHFQISLSHQSAKLKHFFVMKSKQEIKSFQLILINESCLHFFQSDVCTLMAKGYLKVNI